VAIHGTNAPWLIGQAVSHGCIRVHNSVIRRLARLLPLGTPVRVTA
jgi:lipoprotein-anchoring transpeptidase ErfK/SrfK